MCSEVCKLIYDVYLLLAIVDYLIYEYDLFKNWCSFFSCRTPYTSQSVSSQSIHCPDLFFVSMHPSVPYMLTCYRTTLALCATR
jgi:hypothetical protein